MNLVQKNLTKMNLKTNREFLSRTTNEGEESLFRTVFHG